MGGNVDFDVYRCTSGKYARTLDGAGAAKGRHNRWNEFGQCVTYAAASRALALLEVRVHSPSGPPKDAAISVIHVSLGNAQIRRIEPGDLPDGWRHPVDVGHCQIRGSRWYSEEVDKQLLIVPSVLLPAESIYVIRGGIPEAGVRDVESIDFDPRLWEFEHTDKGLVYTIVPGFPL